METKFNFKKIVITSGIIIGFLVLMILIIVLQVNNVFGPKKSPELIRAEQRVAEKEAQANQIRLEKEAKDLSDWQASPSGKLCSKHTDWTRENCDDLINKKIWIGMKYEMLVYLMGKPNSVNPSNYGNGTRYQYCWSGRNPSCFYDNNGDDIIDAYN